MIDVVFEQLRKTLQDIGGEIAERKQVWDEDPIAKGMARATSEIESTIQQIEKDTQLITTEQFAKLHGVTPQAVTRWIRLGELEAVTDAHGYKIHRGAKRKRPRLQRVVNQ